MRKRYFVTYYAFSNEFTKGYGALYIQAEYFPKIEELFNEIMKDIDPSTGLKDFDFQIYSTTEINYVDFKHLSS